MVAWRSRSCMFALWWRGFKKLYKINIFQHREFPSKPFHNLTLPTFPDEARTVPVTFHWTLQTYTKLKKTKNETKYFKKEFDNCFIICNLFLKPTNHKACKSNHMHTHKHDTNQYTVVTNRHLAKISKLVVQIFWWAWWARGQILKC